MGLSPWPCEEADLNFGVAFEVGVSVAGMDMKSAMTKTDWCGQPVDFRYIAASESVREMQ